MYFKLAVPYVAVIPCWIYLQHAWFTILLYHVLALAFSSGNLTGACKGWNVKRFLLFALPCTLAFPLIYLLLPVLVSDTQLSTWLGAHGLNGITFLFMIPYFGIVHPMIEQMHWSGLRSWGWSAHLSFAGYHALVLYSLLPVLWLLVCIAALTGVSWVWGSLDKKGGGGFSVQMIGHVLADTGIILAVLLRL